MVTVVASSGELPTDAAIWGTGDHSVPPNDREALDWLTLCRFLGWHPKVEHSVSSVVAAPPRWLILATEPSATGEGEAAHLAALLDREAVLVLARAAQPGSPLARLSGVAATGARTVTGAVRWTGPGPGREWLAWPELDVAGLRVEEECEPWAFVGDAPLVVARPVGRGHVVTLAAHPGELRDAAPPGTGVLRNLLLWGPRAPVAWLDLEGTMVLRLDDPGSSANTHLRSWSHRGIREPEWIRLAADLRGRDARMSVGYVRGWVDDGDAARGSLVVGGRGVERFPGRVHPSPLVRYQSRDHPDAGAHDHESEYRGLRWLRAAGAGDVELHGYTHVRDIDAWVSADDRYEGAHWYRELEDFGMGYVPSGNDDLVRGGPQFLEAYFGTRPVALLCPGQACSRAAGEAALEAGLEIVAAASLGIRHGERLCWSRHVLSPNLDGPHGCWFEAGLPVIGCFHDRDIALHGPGWLSDRLDRWQEAGALRLIDFRQLAGMLARGIVVEPDGRPRLEPSHRGAPPLVSPVPVRVRTARGVARWSLSDAATQRGVGDGDASAIPAGAGTHLRAGVSPWSRRFRTRSAASPAE